MHRLESGGIGADYCSGCRAAMHDGADDCGHSICECCGRETQTDKSGNDVCVSCDNDRKAGEEFAAKRWAHSDQGNDADDLLNVPQKF